MGPVGASGGADGGRRRAREPDESPELRRRFDVEAEMRAPRHIATDRLREWGARIGANATRLMDWSHAALVLITAWLLLAAVARSEVGYEWTRHGALADAFFQLGRRLEWALLAIALLVIVAAIAWLGRAWGLRAIHPSVARRLLATLVVLGASSAFLVPIGYEFFVSFSNWDVSWVDAAMATTAAILVAVATRSTENALAIATTSTVSLALWLGCIHHFSFNCWGPITPAANSAFQFAKLEPAIALAALTSAALLFIRGRRSAWSLTLAAALATFGALRAAEGWVAWYIVHVGRDPRVVGKVATWADVIECVGFGAVGILAARALLRRSKSAAPLRRSLPLHVSLTLVVVAGLDRNLVVTSVQEQADPIWRLGPVIQPMTFDDPRIRHPIVFVRGLYASGLVRARGGPTVAYFGKQRRVLREGDRVSPTNQFFARGPVAYLDANTDAADLLAVADQAGETHEVCFAALRSRLDSMGDAARRRFPLADFVGHSLGAVCLSLATSAAGVRLPESRCEGRASWDRTGLVTVESECDDPGLVELADGPGEAPAARILGQLQGFTPWIRMTRDSSRRVRVVGPGGLSGDQPNVAWWLARTTKASWLALGIGFAARLCVRAFDPPASKPRFGRRRTRIVVAAIARRVARIGLAVLALLAVSLVEIAQSWKELTRYFDAL